MIIGKMDGPFKRKVITTDDSRKVLGYIQPPITKADRGYALTNRIGHHWKQDNDITRAFNMNSWQPFKSFPTLKDAIAEAKKIFKDF